MTIEAYYIKKLKTQLNTRDEYRGRGLTLKYRFKYKNLPFQNSKNILVHVNSKFCQLQKVKNNTDRNESKNPFTGIKSIKNPE